MPSHKHAPKPVTDTSVLSAGNLFQTRPFQPDATNAKQAVQRKKETAALTNGFDLTKIQYDFSPPPISSLDQPLQAKLTIRKPNNQYEQEADRVAHDLVQRSPDRAGVNNPPNSDSKEDVSLRDLIRDLNRPVRSQLNQPPMPPITGGFDLTKKVLESGPPLSPSYGLPLQAKLTIGAPNDKYEQEADRVAKQVVQRLSFSGGRPSAKNPEQPPQPNQILQRETLREEEDELQMKPLTEQIQRMDLPDDDELQMKPLLQREVEPDDEDELQMKPDSLQREVEPDKEDELQMKPLLQRQGNGAVAASDDLESAIQQSRGGGQPLADSIRQPMEEAFGGVDFGRVKVHTDGRSDQLNRSIQAKAFTTGKDIFFKGGEYKPGSRAGQELIAHELTHVVQQTSALQRKSDAYVIQREPLDKTKLNVVGEKHDDYKEERDRDREKAYVSYVFEMTGDEAEYYWQEYQFKRGKPSHGLENQKEQPRPGGDSEFLLIKQSLTYLEKNQNFDLISRYVEEVFDELNQPEGNGAGELMGVIIKWLERAIDEFNEIQDNLELLVQTNDNEGKSQIDASMTWEEELLSALDLTSRLEQAIDICLMLKKQYETSGQPSSQVASLEINEGDDLDQLTDIWKLKDHFDAYYERVFRRLPTTDKKKADLNQQDVKIERSIFMHETAQESFDVKGVWKIGDSHTEDIELGYQPGERKYNLVRKDVFRNAVAAWQPEKDTTVMKKGSEKSVDGQPSPSMEARETQPEKEYIIQTSSLADQMHPVEKQADEDRLQMQLEFIGWQKDLPEENGNLSPTQTAQLQVDQRGREKLHARKEEPKAFKQEVALAVDTVGSEIIQRCYIGDYDKFDADLGGEDVARDLSNVIFSLNSMIAYLEDSTEWYENFLELLLEAQQELVKWKYENPDLATAKAALCEKLENEIKTHIEHWIIMLEKAKSEGPSSGIITGREWAKMKEAELQRLAMQIVVGNVTVYGETADSLPAQREKQKERKNMGLNTGSVTSTTYKHTAELIERQGVAVCTQFAFAAAHILENNKVRVDVVSGKRSGGLGHTYVVLGRGNDDIWDRKTWGEDCVVIDCWAGAKGWHDFKTLPQVIYPKETWEGEYDIDEHVSDSQRGYEQPDGGTEAKAQVKERKQKDKKVSEEDKKTAEFVKANERPRAERVKESEQELSDRKKEWKGYKWKVEEGERKEPQRGIIEFDEVLTFSSLGEAEQCHLGAGIVFKLVGQREHYSMIRDWDPDEAESTEKNPLNFADYYNKN